MQGYAGAAAGEHDDSGYEMYTQGRQHTNIWSDHGKKRHGPSEASPHVIFLGLDPDFNEADVCIVSLQHSMLLQTLRSSKRISLARNALQKQ